MKIYLCATEHLGATFTGDAHRNDTFESRKGRPFGEVDEVFH